jgi:GntR family transcriptional regulator/MocR family aminotransferase
MKSAIGDLAVALRRRVPAEPAYQQLCAALREAILGGRLRPGARLPSSRALARHLNLARGTIVTAYQQMTAEGYLGGRTGSGTYVADVLPDALLDAGPSKRSARAMSYPARRFSDVARRARHGRRSPDGDCGARRPDC